jgi:hypothetical protein
MNSAMTQSVADPTDTMVDTASTGRAMEGAARAVHQSLGMLAGSAEDMRVRDTGANFFRQHPQQALMIAAAAGAALVLLGGLVTRRWRIGVDR